MKIAALMLSGLSSYDRAKVACETWGRDFDILEVHSFTPCAELPIVKVGRREGPRSCFWKRLEGMFRQRPNLNRADWYLCCSDDNYVWRENLEAMLISHESMRVSAYGESARHGVVIGGHSNLIRIADGTLVKYPSGGAGYVLDRVALERLINSMQWLVPQWFEASNKDELEDAFMGWACHRNHTPYFETPGFFGCNPLDGKCDRGCKPCDRPISYHYVSKDQMRTLHSQGKVTS